MNKTTLLFLYGGQSPEHEVSIITAMQAMNAAVEAGYDYLPVYITKKGRWILGNQTFLKPETYKNLDLLKQKFPNCWLSTKETSPILITKSAFGQKEHHFDVAFPIFHGNHGEDGSVHGMLKLLHIPQVGGSIITHALGLDKHLSKIIAQSLGINTAKSIVIYQQEWPENTNEIVKKAYQLSSKLIVKPAKLGSSIGVTHVQDEKELVNALEVAFVYDDKVLIEEALQNSKEVNISIIGNNPYQTSITEMPLGSEKILSFNDKYLKGGSKKTQTQTMGMASLSRQIPAPLSDNVIKQIEKHAIDFFTTIEGRGVARIDFILVKDKIYFNEINTIPGSLSYYLWEKSGFPFPKLIQKLVNDAQEDFNSKNQKRITFDSNILQNYQSTLGSKK